MPTTRMPHQVSGGGGKRRLRRTSKQTSVWGHSCADSDDRVTATHKVLLPVGTTALIAAVHVRECLQVHVHRSNRCVSKARVAEVLRTYNSLVVGWAALCS
jgi:hypothetical protein